MTDIRKALDEILQNTGKWGHISCAIEADPADGFGYCSCGLQDEVIKPLLALIEAECNKQLKQIEEGLPKKRRPTYRQGRYLPPNQSGAENTDPVHIKMWKCYNTGYNLCVGEVKALLDDIAKLKKEGIDGRF